MRILLFEWMTGGGLWTDGEIPDIYCPVQGQGAAMLTAFANDMRRGGVEPFVPMDSRLSVAGLAAVDSFPIDSASSLQTCLMERAEWADGIMIIAPETDHCLEKCCLGLDGFREKFISPRLEFVKLAANKNSVSSWLNNKGVRVPSGATLDQIDLVANFPGLPAVIKPCLGAGSEDVKFIEDWNSFCPPSNPENWRLETFVPGVPVSVSVLCGPDECRMLHPTGQKFDDSPFGNYTESIFPLDRESVQRANLLAARTVAALPPTHGYIGIDMIIATNGQADDCVVDINPRLTMSYLKLRDIYEENLAMETLRIAQS